MCCRTGVICYDPVMKLRKALDNMVTVGGLTTNEKGLHILCMLLVKFYFRSWGIFEFTFEEGTYDWVFFKNKVRRIHMWM